MRLSPSQAGGLTEEKMHMSSARLTEPVAAHPCTISARLMQVGGSL
ncbi:hypothetical protein AERO9A_230130 [Aeromonas salmonicida]|nr:hypothetical protein AERO9A_230130 [Aeromonas salmonicida]